MLSNNNEQSSLHFGSSFKVDVQTVCISLVSALNRARIIGYPTVYTVLDYSNKLVAGFSICLGEPNLEGVMLALQNAISAKVPFCQEFGIEITESEWPYHIPDSISISSDTATLSGNKMSYLFQTLGIKVFREPHLCKSNWEHVIERYFSTISTQLKVAEILPSLYQESNQIDSHLDATLSFNEFRKIILHMVLYYNNRTRRSNFPVTHLIEEETMEEGTVKQWNWASRTPQSGKTSSKNVELNLLPVAEGSINDRGVSFKGLFYTCETTTYDEQITDAELKESRKVTIVYNPQKVDQIYLKLSDGKRIVRCHLASQSEAFQGLSWHEVHDYQNAAE